MFDVHCAKLTPKLYLRQSLLYTLLLSSSKNNPFAKKEKEQYEKQEQYSMKELQIPNMSSLSIVQHCNELYTYINQEIQSWWKHCWTNIHK